MKRKRFSEEQIIGILKESEAGQENREICRKHGITDFSISGSRLARHLDQLGPEPLPQEIMVDNGLELTSRAMFRWAEKAQVRLCFIEPGKPKQNALVETH